MQENLYCENCGQMLVNGVCPNCNPESPTSAAADAAPASEPVSMPAPGFTPFCETPDGNVKVVVDVTMVAVSILAGLICTHQVVGVREGSIIAAIIVGFIIKFYKKIFKKAEKRIFE